MTNCCSFQQLVGLSVFPPIHFHFLLFQNRLFNSHFRLQHVADSSDTLIKNREILRCWISWKTHLCHAALVTIALDRVLEVPVCVPIISVP